MMMPSQGSRANWATRPSKTMSWTAMPMGMTTRTADPAGRRKVFFANKYMLSWRVKVLFSSLPKDYFFNSLLDAVLAGKRCWRSQPILSVRPKWPLLVQPDSITGYVE